MIKRWKEASLHKEQLPTFFSDSPDRFAILVLDRSAETPGDSAESHTICEAKEGEKNHMTISYLLQPPWLPGTIHWQAAETSLKRLIKAT